MSVIINDFEVVIESPQEAGTGSGEAESAVSSQVPALSPLDIRNILKRQAERMLRIRAY